MNYSSLKAIVTLGMGIFVYYLWGHQIKTDRIWQGHQKKNVFNSVHLKINAKTLSNTSLTVSRSRFFRSCLWPGLVGETQAVTSSMICCFVKGALPVSKWTCENNIQRGPSEKTFGNANALTDFRDLRKKSSVMYSRTWRRDRVLCASVMLWLRIYILSHRLIGAALLILLLCSINTSERNKIWCVVWANSLGCSQWVEQETVTPSDVVTVKWDLETPVHLSPK